MLRPYQGPSLRRAVAGAAPCTRAGGLPPVPPLVVGYSPGCCRRCALHPRRGLAPCTPLVVGYSPGCCRRCALHPRRGLAPCTPIGAVALPQTPCNDHFWCVERSASSCPMPQNIDCTAVARKRHDSALFGTPKDLNFKGSGEMKWPQRGSKGRAPWRGVWGRAAPHKAHGKR
jgi:hypothetical protein